MGGILPQLRRTDTRGQPAGFWIRLGAYIIDALVLIPVGTVATWNTLALRNALLLVAISVPGVLYKPCMEAF